MLAVVHADLLAAAQVPNRDRGVGPVVQRKRTYVDRPELAWGRATGILGVPEDIARGGELVGDGKR
jgi:hypothetical protein